LETTGRVEPTARGLIADVDDEPAFGKVPDAASRFEQHLLILEGGESGRGGHADGQQPELASLADPCPPRPFGSAGTQPSGDHVGTCPITGDRSIR